MSTQPNICRLIMLALTLACSNAIADIGVAKLKVNLRAQPDLSSRIVGVLEPGVRTRIMELVQDSDFVLVERLQDGRRGYLRLHYLNILVTAPSATPPATAETYVSTLRVNLRAKPEPDARIVAVLQTEVPVRLLEQRGEYAKVERMSDGAQGFLKQKYLQTRQHRSKLIAPDPADFVPRQLPPVQDAASAPQ